MRALKTIALAGLMALSANVMAADRGPIHVPPLETYETPEEAMRFHENLSRVKEMLEEKGYEEKECSLNTINYFAPPTSTVYKSHEVRCTFIQAPMNNSLVRHYAQVSADIRYHQKWDVYLGGHVNVEYSIVH